MDLCKLLKESENRHLRYFERTRPPLLKDFLGAKLCGLVYVKFKHIMHMS